MIESMFCDVYFRHCWGEYHFTSIVEVETAYCRWAECDNISPDCYQTFLAHIPRYIGTSSFRLFSDSK